MLVGFGELRNAMLSPDAAHLWSEDAKIVSKVDVVRKFLS